MKRQKKGFTVVELVIVIAVIAILAAVLIPTFSSLIKKAKRSNDTVLVKNLNTIVTTEAAINSNFATPHDAITAVFENGYSVEKLSPTSDGMLILWDTEAKQFVLAKDSSTLEIVYPEVAKNANLESYFKICKTMEEATDSNNEYSVYLGADVAIPADEIALNVGFDAGVNAEVVNFKYTGANKAIVRTNNANSTVVVDNATAEVYWYGVANTLNVVNAAPHSVHVYGTVTGAIEINDGNVVIESGAKVETLKVNKADDAVAVKFAVNSGATVKSLVFKTAIPASNFTISGTVNAAVVDSAVAGAEVVSKLTGAIADASAVITDADKVQAAMKFAGGIGTEKAPYLIASETQWDNLKEMASENYDLTSGKYFSVIADLDFTNKADDYRPTLMKFAGNINFNNNNVYMPEYVIPSSPRYRTLINDVSGNVTIEALNYHANNAIFSSESAEATSIIGYIGAEQTANITFRNINTYGNLNLATNNCGIYIYYPPRGNTGSVISFENCDNYCNIVNTGYTGIYCSTIYKENFEITLNFKDCDNHGTVISGRGAAMFLSNPTCYKNNTLNLTVDNCKNYGQLLTGNGSTPTIAINQNAQGERVFMTEEQALLLETSGKVVNAGGGISVNSNKAEIQTTQDGYFDFESIRQDNAIKYELVFGFNGVQGRGGGVASYRFVYNNDTLSNMRCLTWINNDEHTTNPLQDAFGNIYYITEDNYIFALRNEEKDFNMTAQPVVTMIVYGENEEILSVYTYKYSNQ